MEQRTMPPAFDEVQIFIDPDGTVTICDLWEGLVPVAEALGEVAPPICPLPARSLPARPLPAAGSPGPSGDDGRGAGPRPGEVDTPVRRW